MILVDSSVWVDHLRTGEPELESLLNSNSVCMHSFVIGELACGNLENRSEILGLLGALPQITQATDDEILYFIERNELMGRGIGLVDAHLLAAATMNDSVQLWTRDKRLRELAETLALAYAIN